MRVAYRMGTAKKAFQKFCFETIVDSDGKQKDTCSITITAERGAKMAKRGTHSYIFPTSAHVFLAPICPLLLACTSRIMLKKSSTYANFLYQPNIVGS